MTALLTNSRAKAARQCARFHHHKYVEGWRWLGGQEDLDFGTLIHKALEAWWSQSPGSPDRLTRARLTLLCQDGVDPFVMARARAMIVGYDARWRAADLVGLAVEARFETALINPDTGSESKTWRLAGKLDLIAADIDGRRWIVEHKTSSESLEPGGTYWRRLRMDTQVSTYFDGALALGHDVAGCIYDVLAKPAQRPLKATPLEARKYRKDGALYAAQRDTDETVEEYEARVMEAIAAEPDAHFVRIEVPRLESELHEARVDRWQQAVRMREDERLGRAPRNPDSCMRGNKACEFFDVCAGVATLEDNAAFERVQDVNPELAGEANQPTSTLERGEETPCNNNNQPN